MESVQCCRQVKMAKWAAGLAVMVIVLLGGLNQYLLAFPQREPWLLLVGAQIFLVFLGILGSLALVRQVPQPRPATAAAPLLPASPAVLDAVAAEIVVVSRDGRILAVNEPWCRFARENAHDKSLSQQTMQGWNYFDVCHVAPDSPEAEDAARVREGIQQVLSGRFRSFSMDYPCDSPTERRWFTMEVRPLGLAACDGLVITHVDVTRIKEAEAAARYELAERQKAERESSKLMQAIEQSPIAVFITDIAGRIEYANPRFLANSGYQAAELIGQTPSILRSPETSPATHAELWQTIQAGKTWRGVLCNRRKDGSLVWDDTSISPIFDAAGVITHFVAVKADVTESLMNERELNDYRLRLEELVEQRTVELRDALAAAQVAERAKDEFLANITHELRTPLNAVLGFSSLARPLAQSALQRDYLDKVVSSGSSLAATIDDLLDLSKIAAGCMKFERQPFSIRGLVARCGSVISYKAAEKGLQLTQEVADDVPDNVLGDSLRTEQIMLNLLSNAVKFTESGLVSVKISLLDSSVERICLRLSVADSGIGMDTQELGSLFKPFSQADASITRRFGGTGLGLAICDKLARMMDGKVEVVSKRGVGTRFDVDLWFARGAAGPVATVDGLPGEVMPVRYAPGTRVLVVDDQSFNRDLVEVLLNAVGISPVLLAHGKAALEWLSTHPDGVDLVLMDIQMPVMDGRTATREIRSLERFAGLPIIAMTAHTMHHERERSFEAGMNDHVGKPFNRDTFYRTLARWIAREKQVFAPSAAVPAPADKAAQEPACPAIEGIDCRESLRLMQGNVARYEKWLTDFLGAGPAMLEEIGEALLAEDTDRAGMAAHRLKGRCGFLGMTRAHGLASTLEVAIEARQPHAAIVADLNRTIGDLCVQIQARVAAPALVD